MTTGRLIALIIRHYLLGRPSRHEVVTAAIEADVGNRRFAAIVFIASILGALVAAAAFIAPIALMVALDAPSWFVMSAGALIGARMGRSLTDDATQ